MTRAMTDDDLMTPPEEFEQPIEDEAAGAGYESPRDFEPDLEPEPRPRRADARRSDSRRRGEAPSRSARNVRPQRAAASRGTSAQSASTRAGGLRLAVAFGALALIVAALAFGVWSTLYRAEASVPAGRNVTITIPQGLSGSQIADKLAKAGIVTNATMFRIQAQLMNATADIKTGTYTFVTGSGYEPVIRRLQQGPPAIPTVTITVPEGWGIERTAARIEEKLGIPAADFISLATTGAKQFDFAFLKDNPTPSLEGYLFPKTYTVKVGTKVADLIRIMLEQYGKETAGLDYAYAQSKGLTPHEALTIASIIEREASVASDRPKVASVIYNRLGFHMRLQLDSTVQYALHGKATLTLDDLKTDDPYNTYMNDGLPPGPICSPGIVAIKAALQPAKTKYLYYILTYKDGRQSFATNYADFLKLKAQYKRGLK
jgi:UPF0755 protein